mmetsp:Transcript_3957/g.11370  ORF Transcript_3957/g.11370 Transcript_3957/m.11370 type:complete len:186 (-) Transcript_3957:41-598(-)
MDSPPQTQKTTISSMRAALLPRAAVKISAIGPATACRRPCGSARPVTHIARPARLPARQPRREREGRQEREARAAAMPAIEYLAELDSSTAQTMIFLLKPTLTVYTLLMIVRIVMTWSPELSRDDFPWSIAFKSTEGVLDPTRKVIKPFNGLDVSPIVWVALLSFVSEILTGPQGILNLIVRKGI